MKKVLKLLVLLLIITISPKVLALEVTTVEASETANGSITVKGTTPAEMIAVSVNVYDETGNTLIKTINTNVTDDNKFEVTFDMTPGTYTIKVADYNGGNVKEVKVSVPEEQTNTQTDTQPTENTSTPTETNQEETTTTGDGTNPSTGDAIYMYIIVLIFSLIGMLFIKNKLHI